MIVTGIISQKKRKDRVNVFIDDQFAFSLDLDTLAKSGLTKNISITEEKITQLIKASEYVKYYNLTLRFLSFRPRSEKEVTDYLRKKEVGESTLLMVLNKLKSLNLIDDLKFTNWWLEQRQTFRPRGTRMIKMELFNKGVNKEVIDKVLSEKSLVKEQEMAEKLAEKVRQRYKNLDKTKLYQKITTYLFRRGFDWETIKKVIKPKIQS